VTGGIEEVPEAAEVLDRMTDAFLALDADWRFTYLNDRARTLVCEAAGLDPTAELRGRCLWNVVPDSGASEFADRYEEAVETGEVVTFEAEYEPIDTWFEVRAHPSESGLSVYFQDVTERKRAEARRERDRDALRSLYRIAAEKERSFEEKVASALELGSDYLDIPYGMVNELDGPDLTVAYSHGTPADLSPGTSFPREQAYCKRTVELDELAIVDAMREGWEGDPALDDTGLRCYIGAGMPTEDGVDRTLCFAAPDPRSESFTETERTVVELLAQWLTFEFTRRADRRALEAKNDRLEHLASVVSHDLRNPLTVAQGRLEFVDGADEHVAAVDDALDRIEALIDDLTTLARQGDVIDERSLVDLDAVAADAWRAVPTTTATLDAETGVSLYADGSRLRQALENLFKNAVEHGDEGVHVGVETTADGIAVTDDGPGIPPAEREQVLRMGYTTEETGSGIGMAIVREIVEAHGWTIHVGESESGGARFDVAGIESME
jgi:signal transduction histidine kinase